jgi:MFS family permease
MAVPPSLAQIRPSSACHPALPPAGNLLGLVLSPFILQKFGWRALFYVFGLAGAPLLLLWFSLVPGAAARQQGQQAQQAQQISVGTLLSKPATWAIIAVNFINHFGYFIYLNWMPTYFFKVLGESVKRALGPAFPGLAFPVLSCCACLPPGAACMPTLGLCMYCTGSQGSERSAPPVQAGVRPHVVFSKPTEAAM